MIPSGSCITRQRGPAPRKCSIWWRVASRTILSSAAPEEWLLTSFPLRGRFGFVSSGLAAGSHQAVLVKFFVQGHAADAEFGGGAKAVVVVALQRLHDARGFGLPLGLGERGGGGGQRGTGRLLLAVRGGRTDGGVDLA